MLTALAAITAPAWVTGPPVADAPERRRKELEVARTVPLTDATAAINRRGKYKPRLHSPARRRQLGR